LIFSYSPFDSYFGAEFGIDS